MGALVQLTVNRRASGASRGRTVIWQRCSGCSGCSRCSGELLSHPEHPEHPEHLPPFQPVPDIQQDLEIQLLAPVREVERGHLRLVVRRLRALEGLAIHVIEVGEDAFAGAGHASDLVEGGWSETRRYIIW